jgi:hypothetical protein
MQRVGKEPSPLPTTEEAHTLRQYACEICNVVPVMKLASL